MNKTILYFTTLILLTLTLQAKMIDGIAMIVEGEAITTAEIRAVQTQLSVSKEEAENLLIQDRLQKSAMKDVKVSEESIDAKIAEIAAQNNLTIKKMQKILLQQGTPWVKYRKSIKEGLKKSKFFQKEVVSSIPNPSKDELHRFYNANKKLFTIPSRITVKEYSSRSKKKIDAFLKTRRGTHIRSRTITKYTKKMEPALLSTLLETQKGNYTRPINTGAKYIVFKILSKKGKISMPFESAQGAVTAKWKQQQQQKALKDYFEKLRTRADIQKIR
ncbi:MAG: peptidyl-prolyl cis-trans isomerase [Sulfurovum sp.]|nr:peptidyl-prolyl cis-trans isomerase [Sulfurovum sp.]